jgi:hypothetical protein
MLSNPGGEPVGPSIALGMETLRYAQGDRSLTMGRLKDSLSLRVVLMVVLSRHDFALIPDRVDL